jgi:ADP-ribose pyrophosphatase YjhB (NUDIX family)
MNTSNHSGEDSARFAYLAEGNAAQARKRVAVKLLIQDQAGRMLLVNPTYKEYWDLPGGMVEANEPPKTAAIRELQEELGYTPTIGNLLRVEWDRAHGPWDDQLILTFDGGILTTDDVEQLRVIDPEISEFGFFDLSHATGVLRPDIAQQLASAHYALRTRETAYYERHHQSS